MAALGLGVKPSILLEHAVKAVRAGVDVMVARDGPREDVWRLFGCSDGPMFAEALRVFVFKTGVIGISKMDEVNLLLFANDRLHVFLPDVIGENAGVRNAACPISEQNDPSVALEFSGVAIMLDESVLSPQPFFSLRAHVINNAGSAQRMR